MLTLLLDNKHYIISGACLCVAAIAMIIALIMFVKLENRKKSLDEGKKTSMNLTTVKTQVQELLGLLDLYSPLRVLADSVERAKLENVFQGSNLNHVGCLLALRSIQSKYKEQGVGGSGCVGLRASYLAALNSAIKAACCLEFQSIISVIDRLDLDKTSAGKQIGALYSLIKDSSSNSALERSRSCPDLLNQRSASFGVGDNPSSTLHSVNSGKSLGDKSMAQ